MTHRHLPTLCFIFYLFFFFLIYLKTKQICKTEGLLILNLLLINSMCLICLFLPFFLNILRISVWNSKGHAFPPPNNSIYFKTASPFLCVCLCVCGGFALSSLIKRLLEMLLFRCHSGEFSHLSLDWNKTRMSEPNWASLTGIHAINPRKKKRPKMPLSGYKQKQTRPTLRRWVTRPFTSVLLTPL